MVEIAAFRLGWISGVRARAIWSLMRPLMWSLWCLPRRRAIRGLTACLGRFFIFWKKEIMGEHTAGQAAVGPDPTQHPPPFPEAPRISNAGREPQRKLSWEVSRVLGGEPGRRQREGDPAPVESPDCTEQEAETQGRRDLMGPEHLVAAPGQNPDPLCPRPGTPSSGPPHPRELSQGHSPSDSNSGRRVSKALPCPLSMALADILEAVWEH